MKIALIGTTLFNQGAEYVLASVARGLANCGHEVTVVLSKYQEVWQAEHPEWKPFELPQSVQVVVLSACRARNSIVQLRKMIKKGGYDVIMSHSASHTEALAVASLGLKRKTKLIHVEHSGLIGVNYEGERSEPNHAFRTRLSNWLMSQLDAQFAVSEGTANAISRMTGYPREKVYTVYNPVIDDLFLQKQQQMPQFNSGVKNRNVPIVMAAGAFCDLKRHLLLIEAFAKVLESHDAQLVIWGDGSLRQAYEEKIQALGLEGKVFLPGFTNCLPAELKNADCFVVSSTIESFSIVLVEALACGVPVVATDCPYGPREILHDGAYGELVKNKDVEALANGIKKVLSGQGVLPTPQMVEPFEIKSVIRAYETNMRTVLNS